MTATISFRLNALKPRNPHAVSARLRRAGAHRPGTGALRQAAKQQLRAELADNKHPPPAR